MGLFADITFACDDRVNPDLELCLYCQLGEPYRRLTHLTVWAKQCPTCQRVFVVANPPEDGEARQRDEERRILATAPDEGNPLYRLMRRR